MLRERISPCTIRVLRAAFPLICTRVAAARHSLSRTYPADVAKNSTTAESPCQGILKATSGILRIVTAVADEDLGCLSPVKAAGKRSHVAPGRRGLRH